MICELCQLEAKSRSNPGVPDMRHLLAAAYRKGAEEMRERAAVLCWRALSEQTADDLGDAIRALPLPGEAG